ncbi:MAG: division/cell wall cluster transcriptional repressor MraZ [Deltaproteobacteria bacterium]|nr:division/cell wall cluster transcriptional repressor MraZ [Deltaproteobacteria bacterium]
MFHGQVRTSVDHKGRTSVPSNFRSELTDTDERGFAVAQSLDPCLVAYPTARWRDFGQRLAAMAAEHDPAARMARRWYLGGTFALAVDGQGRVLLPPALRAWAGVGKEVVWVGVGDHLEIWDPERFSEVQRTVLTDPAAVAKALAEKGL